MGCVGSSAIKGVESKSLPIPLPKRIKKSCPSPFSVLLIAKWRILSIHRIVLGQVGLNTYGALERGSKSAHYLGCGPSGVLILLVLLLPNVVIEIAGKWYTRYLDSAYPAQLGLETNFLPETRALV